MTTRRLITQLIVMAAMAAVVTTMMPSLLPVVIAPVVLHVVTILPFTRIGGRRPQRRRTKKQNGTYHK